MGEKWKLYDLTESLLYFIVRLNHPILFMYVTKPRTVLELPIRKAKYFKTLQNPLGHDRKCPLNRPVSIYQIPTEIANQIPRKIKSHLTP